MFPMPGRFSSAQVNRDPNGIQLKIQDAELLNRYVAKNDQQAFAELMHRHGPMVLAIARRIVADVDLADDVFQASFLVLARKSNRLLQHTSLAGWLFEVTTRLSRRAYSQSVRRSWYEKKAIAKPNSEAGQLDAVIRNEETVAILEAVAKLQPVYRHAFVLCYLQGKNRHEASRALDCLPDTLSGRLARAKKILSVRLRQRGVTPAVLGGITSSLATSAVLSQTLMQATLHVVELSRPTSAVVEELVGSLLTVPAMNKWITIIAITSMIAIGSYLAISIGEGQEKHSTTPAQADRSAVTISPNAVKVPAALTTTPFSISGVVRGIDDKPVPGATVFLLGTFLRIETKTDASGSYRFDQVPVPLLDEKWWRENLSTYGLAGKFNMLQVAAKSNGRPFTWSNQFGVKPETRPAGDNNQITTNYYASERGKVDLQFKEAGQLTGRITDTANTPMAGAELEIITVGQLVQQDANRPHYLSDFQLLSQAPREWSHFRTDSQGRFDTDKLPANKLYWFRVKHPALPDYTFWSHTAIGKLPVIIPEFKSEMEQGRQPTLFTSPIELQIERARLLSISVRGKLQGTAVSGVRFGMYDASKPKSYGMDAWGYAIHGTTDSRGMVELRVPSGKFRWYADPTVDSIFVRTYGYLTVTAEPPIQHQEIFVDSGAKVKFLVVDGVTGKGVPGCTFMEQSMVSSSTVWIDPNKDQTGEDGTMTAVLPERTATFRVIPPTKQITPVNDKKPRVPLPTMTVLAGPSIYKEVEPVSVVLKAGETTDVKFVLKR